MLRPLVQRYIDEALTILRKKTRRKVRCDSLTFSPRMTSTLGHATFKYDRKSADYHYSIRISKVIFKGDSDVLRETVYHEVAHVADHQIYKEWGHGPTWEKLMGHLGLEPKVYAEVEDYASIGYEVPPRMILGRVEL